MECLKEEKRKDYDNSINSSSPACYRAMVVGNKMIKRMVWQDYKIDSDKITLTRQEIQEARDHYCKVSGMFMPRNDDADTDFRYGYYVGKADVLTDMLKMFEPLEL